MDMHWFDDVLTLLEERNMTRAAARRNITQPAFSRRIRAFEDWLGVPVLDRRSNRVEISPSLRDNEAEIRALIAHLQELRRKIAHHDPSASEVALAAQHSTVSSAFPDMALRARQAFPGLRFRLRAANLNDCMTLFLRRETNLLLCYEAQQTAPLQFGAQVRRGLWGTDYMIPVVGGALRYTVKDNKDIPQDSPAVVYPEDSYFGRALNRAQCAFGTATHSVNPVCQTAFSSGIHEMVRSGLGVGWLPFSMVHREVESGAMISLANRFGMEPLDVVIYANDSDEQAAALLEFWAKPA